MRWFIRGALDQLITSDKTRPPKGLVLIELKAAYSVAPAWKCVTNTLGSSDARGSRGPVDMEPLASRWETICQRCLS